MFKTREELAYERLTAREQTLCEMTPEDLGREWRKQCGRHDRAVDRGEVINSPTIESARGWMNFIEEIFKERGLKHWDYTDGDEVVAGENSSGV